MKEEIPTSEYMVDGWDRGPAGCHHYKRGSFHNKFGMWIMWLFYGIVQSPLQSYRGCFLFGM